MRRHQIPQFKMNLLRRSFIDGTFVSNRIAKELKISTVTSWRYWKEFVRIKEQFPEKLENMDFYMTEKETPHRSTPIYNHFLSVLPQLLSNEPAGVKARPLWLKYKAAYPEGYTYSPFKILFYKWLEQHPEKRKPKLLEQINPADQQTLTSWRRSNNHRNWQIAVALEMATQGSNATEIMAKTECGRLTLTRWLNAYKAKGLPGFEIPKHETNIEVVKTIETRKERLIKLVHETPKLHGLNRTSWSITALHQVYNQIHPEQITYMQVNRCINQLGFSYKKSRDMLTSPDPKFREKLNKIQHILQHLGKREKFFSIDEYGPVSVKIKGGRTLKQKGESADWVPDKQKCKGLIICIAAIELSTNQVTHFFSKRKNTFEMIKLIDVLVAQYKEDECLYLSWDAVSWHNSKILKNYIEDHNQVNKPIIKLAPLPSTTQYLNIIESVFSGLARAVIHNSDYATEQDCKDAISQHFETRNKHFQAHPKRAGNKIWGKEIVVPKFSETNHCRVRSAMRGAK